MSFFLMTALVLTSGRHQKQALTFMLTRERGWTLDGTRPDLWEEVLHNARGQY